MIYKVMEMWGKLLSDLKIYSLHQHSLLLEVSFRESLAKILASH